jgi:hypothetical protein
MPPVTISLPPQLVVAVWAVTCLWALASVLVVWMCLRMMIAFVREGARRTELLAVEHRLDGQHKGYVEEATRSRESLQVTVSKVSQDVSRLIGKLEGVHIVPTGG